jgi:hypothetical protein
MDFLKRHWEKILLSLVLVGVIGMGAWLAFSVERLNSEIREAPNRPPPKGEKVKPLDKTPLASAAEALQSPVLWDAIEADPFRAHQRVVEVAPGTNTQTGPVEEPLTLVRIERKPFKLLFKAYSWDAEKETGYNFQINFQYRGRTFFVPVVGDPIRGLREDTGYVSVSFAHKVQPVFRPDLGKEMEEDQSVLTIKHDDEKPIELVLGKVGEEQEPVATLRCEVWPAPARLVEVRRGQAFECGGRGFIVVDITQKQVVIKDQKSAEKRTLDLRKPGELEPGQRPWGMVPNVPR